MMTWVETGIRMISKRNETVFMPSELDEGGCTIHLEFMRDLGMTIVCSN